LKEQLDKPGPDPLDWETIIPKILQAVGSGLPIIRAIRAQGLTDDGDLWRRLSSDRWRAEMSEAKRAGALARVDRSHDRLLALAESEPGTVKKEQIDAARWEAEHGKWWAERVDPESFGREDRVKIASVSAIRVIVETPPQAALLPPIPATEALPVGGAQRLLQRGE
jgi:hypothetical protein